MATRCPNCDQPLRDGAKFCTSCGYRLAVPKPTPAFPITPPPIDSSQEPKSKPQPEPKAQQAIPLAEIKDEPGAGRVTCPHCGKPNRLGVKFCRYCGGSITKVAEAPQRSRARIITLGFLVLVILMVCVSLVGIAWGLGIDQWLFPTATPNSGVNTLPSFWI